MWTCSSYEGEEAPEAPLVPEQDLAAYNIESDHSPVNEPMEQDDTPPPATKNPRKTAPKKKVVNLDDDSDEETEVVLAKGRGRDRGKAAAAAKQPARKRGPTVLKLSDRSETDK